MKAHKEARPLSTALSGKSSCEERFIGLALVWWQKPSEESRVFAAMQFSGNEKSNN